MRSKKKKKKKKIKKQQLTEGLGPWSRESSGKTVPLTVIMRKKWRVRVWLSPSLACSACWEG